MKSTSMKKYLFSFLLQIFILGCKTEDKNLLILGKWRNISNKENGKEMENSGFHETIIFNPDNTYLSSYLSFQYDVEKGNYKLENDSLLKKDEKGNEIKLKISKITYDTMKLEIRDTIGYFQAVYVKIK